MTRKQASAPKRQEYPEEFRRRAKHRIEQTIAHHGGQPELDIVMAIGKCCTAATREQHQIWNEEARLAIALHAASEKGEA